MILVTGSSGHLGHWLVAELIDRGYDVLCLARRPASEPQIKGLRWSRSVRTVACDLSDRESLARHGGEFAAVEAVFHCAAFIPDNTATNAPEDALQTLRYNVQGTINLLEVLRDSPRLHSLIYASTFEVYGAPMRLPVDEQHPTRPLSYYGASKLAGEKYANLFGADRGVNVSLFRLPAIYGPGDRLRRAVGNFIRCGVSCIPITIDGSGEDRRELVYCRDVAAAFLQGLEAKAQGIYNLGTGKGYSIREIAEAVRAVEPRIPSIEHRERTKPQRDYVLSVDRAKSDLSWSPATALVDGVRAQLAWLREDLGIAGPHDSI